MPKYRAEIQITAYIEVTEDAENYAIAFLQDEASFPFLATEGVAFLDRVEVLNIKRITSEQFRCDQCNSLRWSDTNGCAECGNLNDRWRD